MKYAELAKTLDLEDADVVEIAWAYELAIQEPDAEVTVFLNLVALYFECNDPGFSAGKRIPNTFADHAYSRAFEVLDLAAAKDSVPEIDFWRLYLRDRVLGETIPDEAYLALTQRETAQPGLPYLAVYANSNGRLYPDQAAEIITAATSGETTRLRYIRSFKLPKTSH